MGLAIGVKENDIVYVGDVAVRVKEIRGFEYAVVEVDGQDFVVTDLKATEIIPDVFVSCGKPGERFVHKQERLLFKYEEAKKNAELTGREPPVFPGNLLPRLIFDAPRSIVIDRAELYEAKRTARVA